MTLEELRATSREEIMRLAADCGVRNVRDLPLLKNKILEIVGGVDNSRKTP